MKLLLLCAALMGCGGPASMEEITDRLVGPDAQCNFCPGAASATTATFSDGTTMTTCLCAGVASVTSGPNMEFRSDPPLASCAHAACVFADICNGNVQAATGCPP